MSNTLVAIKIPYSRAVPRCPHGQGPLLWSRRSRLLQFQCGRVAMLPRSAQVDRKDLSASLIRVLEMALPEPSRIMDSSLQHRSCAGRFWTGSICCRSSIQSWTPQII